MPREFLKSVYTLQKLSPMEATREDGFNMKVVLTAFLDFSYHEFLPHDCKTKPVSLPSPCTQTIWRSPEFWNNKCVFHWSYAYDFYFIHTTEENHIRRSSLTCKKSQKDLNIKLKYISRLDYIKRDKITHSKKQFFKQN